MYAVHYRNPSVERLGFYLPGQQPAIFSEDSSISTVVNQARMKESQFLAWFKANSKYAEASQLTYSEFPSKFVWKDELREWVPRQKGFSVGRMNYIHPRSRELYYMRCLLNVVKGPKSFRDLRKIDGVQYETYKDACYCLGLLEDDGEYIDAMKEASHWASAATLKNLFVSILLSCSITYPGDLWTKSWHYMSDDISYRNHSAIGEVEIQNFILIEIEKSLQRGGTSLRDFPDIPYPTGVESGYDSNVLIMDELSYDHTSQIEIHKNFLEKCTVEQLKVHDTVLHCCNTGKGGVYFLYGYGGTGKTFIWNGMATALKSKGEIVLCVASSSIASLLLPGGRTAHSRFKIPIEVTEDSICGISPKSPLAGLIQKAKLIIWDESPMTHRHCFEALDKTLRDVMRPLNSESINLPFGGKIIVFWWRLQTNTSCSSKRYKREQIINASLNSSRLWNLCTVMRLTENMRLRSASTPDDRSELDVFSRWLCSLGDGSLNKDNDGLGKVEIPSNLIIHYKDDPVSAIVSAIYPSFDRLMSDSTYLKERAILAPTLKAVEVINSYMMSLNNEESRTYLSADIASLSDGGSSTFSAIHTQEFLNSIECSGMPPHSLTLKIGTHVMLLRNIDSVHGLCNGTRLVLTRMGKNVLEGEVLNGDRSGDRVLIPPMSLTSSDHRILFKFVRRQFPLIVCYAMTINKSQCQSLQNVGVFLKDGVFTHGQLYVAASRVVRRSGLKFLLAKKDYPDENNMTLNVVYKEILQKI